MRQRNFPPVHLNFSCHVVHPWSHRLLGLNLSLRRWLKRISILSGVDILPVEWHRSSNRICCTIPALFSCLCCIQWQPKDGFLLTSYVNIWLFHTWLPVIVLSQYVSFSGECDQGQMAKKPLNTELFLNFEGEKNERKVHLNFSASFSRCSDVTGTQKGKINLVESSYAAECPLSVSASLSLPLFFKLSHLIS